jgi:hypothetical protein
MVMRIVLSYNRQHSKFVINNQCFCIVIRFIMYICYMFHSSWIIIRQSFMKCTIRYWIVFLMWIHILFNRCSGGWSPNWVHSTLRPPIGLLCQPRVIMMMEKLVEWLAGETEVLGENLPSTALSTTTPHTCPDANPGRRGGKPATNRLSYGTALWIHISNH